MSRPGWPANKHDFCGAKRASSKRFKKIVGDDALRLTVREVYNRRCNKVICSAAAELIQDAYGGIVNRTFPFGLEV